MSEFDEYRILRYRLYQTSENGTTKIVCKLCRARCDTQEELERHIESKHPDTCDFCGDKMWSEGHREKHMQRRHPYAYRKRFQV